MQATLLQRATDFRTANTREAHSYDEMKKILANDGGFVRAYFEPNEEVEERVQNETKAAVRCIPLEQPSDGGKCIVTGADTKTEVLFAQAY